MKPSIDYTGQTFSKLTAIERVGKKRGMNLWRCKCECGNEKICLSVDLKRGHTKSCGCDAAKTRERHYKWNGYQEITSTFWGRAARSARDRSIEFNITIEEAWNLYISQNKRCALSGMPIYFQKKSYIWDGTCSLDRKDSSKPYTKDNVQWVHKEVNKIKQDLSDDKLIYWCCLIAKNRRDSNSNL